MINDFETWLFAEIVDAREVEQIIERKFVAAKLRDFTEIGRCDPKSRLAAELSFVLQSLAE